MKGFIKSFFIWVQSFTVILFAFFALDQFKESIDSPATGSLKYLEPIIWLILMAILLSVSYKIHMEHFGK